MAANLYARSIFGEDALANVSIEKPSDQSGPSVTGHVRIRAKSQVMDNYFVEGVTISLTLEDHDITEFSWEVKRTRQVQF